MRGTSPGAGTTSFTYNEHGELEEETDARGVLTKRIPDELDRVTKVEYLTGGTSLVPELTTNYTYDDPAVDFSKGRLTAISRSGASVDYTYDRFGRVTQDGGLGYGYDDNGNRTTVDYPSGVTATYSYDFADRQETLSVDDGVNPAQSVVTAATYLPSGPLATLNLGNGAVETRGFTTRYFPETIDLAANLQRTWTYTTDDVGNVTQVVETTDCVADLEILGGQLSGPDTREACMTITSTGTTIESGTVVFRAGESIELSDFTVNAGATFVAENDPRLAATTTFTYGYLDTQYFLTCATGPWGPAAATCAPTPSADALQWSYDRIGNRLSETRTFEAAPPPEPEPEDPIHALAPITQADTYTYLQNTTPANTPILATIDRDGSTAATYTYGAGGHLEEVDRGANVIDFISDAAGRLSGLDRLGEMANFTYDGRSFLQQAERPLGESDQATTDPTYSSEGRLYCLTRQEDVAAIPETVDYFYFAGRPVAQRHGDGVTETWTFLTTDHLGTPAIATNISGDETWLGPFEPFGADYGTGAAAEEIFLRLPGQWDDGRWADAAMGADLYYNVHRWYEQAAGRYGRPDPWGRLGDPHPYNYGRSNPLTFADFLGQKSRTCCTPISQAIGLRREKHCFIEVQNPDSGKKSTYSLHGMGTPRRNWGGPIGCTFVSDRFDSTASNRPGYDCGDWSDDCAPDECVKQQHRNYPRATRYRPLGPNSNTFAGNVTRACGLDPPPIVGRLRTPGWNKPMPPNLFLPSLRGVLTSLGTFCPDKRRQ